MDEKFNLYTISDVRELIQKENLEPDIYNDADNDRLKHLLKPFNRKTEKIYIFTKKGFEKYSENYDVEIVGKIRKRQKYYTDYVDFIELKKNKTKKNIIGRCDFSAENDSLEDKKYDVRASDNSHTVGYAWVGNNQFIQVTTFNPLLFLIPFILACIIIILLSSCPNPDVVLPWAEQTDISDENSDNNPQQAPLCYFVPFAEKITLTEESKEIKLRNVKENEGNYYISYEVFVDGKIIDISGDTSSTGLIMPGNQVNLDLWSKLDSGTYNLVCKATEYGYQNKDKKDINYDLTTTLVVEK